MSSELCDISGGKDSLTVKAFRELLRGIPDQDKAKFSKDKAEQYYRQYQENYVDDRLAVTELAKEFAGKNLLILAPGKSLMKYKDEVLSEIKKKDTVVIAVNFYRREFPYRLYFQQ